MSWICGLDTNCDNFKYFCACLFRENTLTNQLPLSKMEPRRGMVRSGFFCQSADWWFKSTTRRHLVLPKGLEMNQALNLPLFDVPLSHFIMRPSIAVPRPSFFQTASD